MRLPQVAVVVALAIAALQLTYYYPQLPAVVASHFNAVGTPNAWQPKGAFVGLMCFVYALFAIMAFAMPHIIASVPPALVNLPNKAYWLAPERREHTVRLIGDQMGWLGAFEIIFIVCVVQFAINANLPGSNGHLAPAFLGIAAFFIVILLAWTLRFYRMFSRTSS